MINEDLTLAYMWVEPHLISSSFVPVGKGFK